MLSRESVSTSLATSPSLSGRAYLAVVKYHCDASLHPHNGVATVALCHLNARSTPKPGDVLFSVPCKHRSAFGVDCTERLLLQVLAVDQTLSLSQYYGPRAAPWTHNRQDRVYRMSVAAETGQLQETLDANEDAIKTIERWQRANKSN